MSIIHTKRDVTDETEEQENQMMIFIQYRGRLTDKFEHAMQQIEAPCKVILFLGKLKSVLPSLKPSVEKRCNEWCSV